MVLPSGLLFQGYILRTLATSKACIWETSIVTMECTVSQQCCHFLAGHFQTISHGELFLLRPLHAKDLSIDHGETFPHVTNKWQATSKLSPKENSTGPKSSMPPENSTVFSSATTKWPAISRASCREYFTSLKSFASLDISTVSSQITKLITEYLTADLFLIMNFLLIIKRNTDYETLICLSNYWFS